MDKRLITKSIAINHIDVDTRSRLKQSHNSLEQSSVRNGRNEYKRSTLQIPFDSLSSSIVDHNQCIKGKQLLLEAYHL